MEPLKVVTFPLVDCALVAPEFCSNVHTATLLYLTVYSQSQFRTVWLYRVCRMCRMNSLLLAEKQRTVYNRSSRAILVTYKYANKQQYTACIKNGIIYLLFDRTEKKNTIGLTLVTTVYEQISKNHWIMLAIANKQSPSELHKLIII